MQNVIVTGGAGFIGSHVCKGLYAAGFTPVTVDNLRMGWREAIRFGPFHHCDIMDRVSLFEAFRNWNPVAVVHLAASTSVAESVADPESYRACNVNGTGNIIDAMLAYDCPRIVFSSTCAVYGDSTEGRVDERFATNPESPYAETKLAAENLLRKASVTAGVRATVFRYFNVAGADPEQEIGEWRPTPSNLIPSVLECAAGNLPEFRIFGDDYPTPDGTCIRDYVHVADVAEAHVAGLMALLGDAAGGLYNLGTGVGYSVREVVDCCRRITGVKFPVKVANRRPGDVSRIVCDSSKACAELGWSPQRSLLETITTDAWHWRKSGGYSR